MKNLNLTDLIKVIKDGDWKDNAIKALGILGIIAICLSTGTSKNGGDASDTKATDTKAK